MQNDINNNTKDTELKKFDSHSNIVWKYKRNNINFSISIVLLLIPSIVYFYFLIEGFNKYINRKDDTDFLTALALLAGVAICLFPPYRLIKFLNQKALYITQENIVFEKYIGKTTIMPSGVLCFYEIGIFGVFVNGGTTKVIFYRIDSKDYEPLLYFIMSGDELKELYACLLPKIEAYLIELKEEDYMDCKLVLNIRERMNRKIDLKKIEKLRKERKNAE